MTDSGQRTLILGTGNFAQSLMQELDTQPACGYHVVGVVEEKTSGATSTCGFPILGDVSQLRELIRQARPDVIIVALTRRQDDQANHQLLEARVCKGICIEDAEAVYEKLTGKLPIESMTPNGMIYSNDFQPSPGSLLATRLFSLTCAIVGIVALSPLLVLIAILIKLDSRGPVLFVQERVGMDGKPFSLYKFRTMRPEGKTSEWAGDNEHRITRTGRWLRKYRLDELPQFFNILFNDMNIVGPRPHPASNFRLFVLVSRNTPECGVQIPYYSLRLRVRPGITGWAQVRYQYANNLKEEIEKLKFDLYYVKHYSFWLDVKILLETVKIVFKGHEISADSYNAPANPATAAPQSNA